MSDDPQKPAFRADQTLTAADALFMAEQTQDYVSKRVSPLRAEVESLRETVASQFKLFKELIEVLAKQPRGVDKSEVAAVIKELFFQHEHQMLRTMAALSQQMDGIENSALMEFKGPHRADDQYYRGDVTQRDGRTYVALVANKGDAPGKSPAWRAICVGKESS